jgi:hypothetical protein
MIFQCKDFRSICVLFIARQSKTNMAAPKKQYSVPSLKEFNVSPSKFIIASETSQIIFRKP